MANSGISALSPSEARLLSGKKRTKGDLVVADIATKSVLKRFLTAEVERRLPDGTTVTTTLEEDIVLGALMEARENPTLEKVERLMRITGQLQTEKVESASVIDEDLTKRSLGDAK